MKHLKFLLLGVLAIITISCQEDDGTGPEPVIPVDPIQASFTYSISSDDPFTAIFTNTSSETGDFTTVWDFGQGGGQVADEPGNEEVRFPNPGTYTVTLSVSNIGGTTTATEEILVDASGICQGGICGELAPLKDVASFTVGVITSSGKLTNDALHRETLTRDFNSLTAEWEMKMDQMYPTEGNYNFTASDAIVNFGVNNGMNVHGHALIWHNSVPSWVQNFAGTDQEFEDMIKDYITTVVTRYKDQVTSWDVVNEALSDDSGHPLRQSVFRQRMGPDYIQKCFQWARDADPDCLLFYNDYNIAAVPSKRNAAFAIMDDLGALGDGIGAQMHISIDGPSASNIQDIADKAIERDLLVHFSEIDIRTNPEGNNSVSSLSDSKAAAQQAKYREVVEIFNDIPVENQYALTVWGVKDNESWLINFWGVPDWPLLYDADYNRKKSYLGFLEGLE